MRLVAQFASVVFCCSETFCGKKLYSLHFYYAKEIFKSSWHPFVTCCELTFKFHRRNFILRIKWVKKIKVKPLMFVMYCV